ncbi:SDR family NAD(P)-dependent oxidoreductase [Sulfurimonas sp.]|uniref:SDR family NAD(P)-dependent oxidoreductase n=1 Tax=Sulfurimonas sp. TaxID=2022749 RepID=UPI0025CBEC7F|nr:SDR family NAD(P)-dependent oxidoreductase [Sulfurimonas sp.]MCK9473532.1 SDR family NAD(P)-dependent oxidoreductase [Sulfurimonas sp.]
MQDKIVLVTGANGGLGNAFIEVLLEQKAKKIYAAARDINSLAHLKHISNIELLELDITDISSVKAAREKASDIDVLINNAGINSGARVFDGDFSDMEVNYKGTANLCKSYFEYAKEHKMQIINISSIVALCNLPIMAKYSISKSALHSFTQALRAELKAYDSEVYEVFAGPIDTRLTKGVDMPKADPIDVAKMVIKDVKEGVFDIFPDIFAQMVRERLATDPKGVEADFTKSLAG